MKLNVKKIIYTLTPSAFHPIYKRIEKSDLGYRLVKGSFWSLLGAVVSRILILGSYVVIARFLGKAGYGQFGIIQSTISMFAIFAGFGLGVTSSKHVAEFREKDPVHAGKIMSMTSALAVVTGAIIALVLFIYAPWLAERTLNDPDLTPLLRISSVILIFEAMNGAQLGTLGGFEAFRTIAKNTMWVGLASCPMMILGVYYGGLAGSVWGLALNRALNWLLNHISIRHEASRNNVPMKLGVSMDVLPVVWKYSVPAMLSSVLVSPTIWVCNAMLVNQPDGYEKMGIFQANKSLQQALMFLGTTLGAPLLPMLSHMIGSGRKSELFARTNILSTWAIGIIPTVILIGIPEIGTMIYGKEYSGTEFISTYLFILLSASIMIYRHGLSRVLLSNNLAWWGMVMNVVWAIMMIGFTKYFIGKGVVGYALAWPLSYGINTIIFIPLFTMKKLVPPNTLISVESILIWVFILIMMALSYYGISFIIRVVLLPPVLVIIVLLFWRILKQK